jgi:hypothetical protein
MPCKATTNKGIIVNLNIVAHTTRKSRPYLTGGPAFLFYYIGEWRGETVVE